MTLDTEFPNADQEQACDGIHSRIREKYEGVFKPDLGCAPTATSTGVQLADQGGHLPAVAIGF